MWKFYAILSAVFAALTAIFAKAGLKNINPDLATAIRTIFVLFISWGFVFMNGKSRDLGAFTKSNWIFLILSGLATGLSWLFYYRALQQGTTSVVSAIDKASLVLVVLLAFLFLKEPLTPKILLGTGLILAGMLLLIWK
jgi:bacterial/archaeal transporter family protein